MKVPITRPYFDGEERRLALEVIDSGWLVQGRFVAELEARFREYTGAREAVAMSSCTAAQFIAARIAGLGEGDEAIVPAFTWVSTANAVLETGARPRFVDIDLGTWNIDPAAIEKALSPKTAALCPVHLFGRAAPMDRIAEIAEARRITILEDCACSLGGRHRGRHTGTFGHSGCFSMHPRKSITTGEGGVYLTNDASAAATARSLRDHGADRSDFERHGAADSFLLPNYAMLGFNQRLTDLQAAVGVAQFAKFGRILELKHAQAARYAAAFAGLEALRTPDVDGDHGLQAYVCLLFPEEAGRLDPFQSDFIDRVERLSAKRTTLMRALEARGIATRPGTHCAALTRHYSRLFGITPRDVPNSFIAERLSVAIPLFAGMSSAEQEHVIESTLAEVSKLCAE